MAYYFYELQFPVGKPFDKPDFLWPTFVGEFVKPVVTGPVGLLYWFTFYGGYAQFCLYTDQFEALQVTFDQKRDALGLIEQRRPRASDTLIGAFGSDRFVASQGKDKEQRSLLVLRQLHAVCALYVDHLVQRADGYWEPELNADGGENPEGSAFETLLHLFCNITRVKTPIFDFDLKGKHHLQTGFAMNKMEKAAGVRATVNQKTYVRF